MPNRECKGCFGTRDRQREYEAQSKGGQRSWQTRERKPGEIERLKAIGAMGGHKGGGDHRSQQAS